MEEVIATVVPEVEEMVETAASAIKGETLDVGTALLDGVLGYVVVFIGLTLLMYVVIAMGKLMVARSRKEKGGEAAPAIAPPVQQAASKELAPGSAGEIKLYDTDPRDAAMIMAIVAEKLQKPLNELRFVSIKEVK